MTAEQETATSPTKNISPPRWPDLLLDSPYKLRMILGVVCLIAADTVRVGDLPGPESFTTARVGYLVILAALGLTLLWTGWKATKLRDDRRRAFADSSTVRREYRALLADRDRLRGELVVMVRQFLDDPTEPGRDDLHATLIQMFSDHGSFDPARTAATVMDELPAYGLRIVADHGPVPFVPVLDQMGASPKLLGELLGSRFGGGKGAAMIRAAQVTDPDAAIVWVDPEAGQSAPEWKAPEDRS